MGIFDMNMDFIFEGVDPSTLTPEVRNQMKSNWLNNTMMMVANLGAAISQGPEAVAPTLAQGLTGMLQSQGMAQQLGQILNPGGQKPVQPGQGAYQNPVTDNPMGGKKSPSYEPPPPAGQVDAVNKGQAPVGQGGLAGPTDPFQLPQGGIPTSLSSLPQSYALGANVPAGLTAQNLQELFNAKLLRERADRENMGFMLDVQKFRQQQTMDAFSILETIDKLKTSDVNRTYLQAMTQRLFDEEELFNIKISMPFRNQKVTVPLGVAMQLERLNQEARNSVYGIWQELAAAQKGRGIDPIPLDQFLLSDGLQLAKMYNFWVDRPENKGKGWNDFIEWYTNFESATHPSSVKDYAVEDIVKAYHDWGGTAIVDTLYKRVYPEVIDDNASFLLSSKLPKDLEAKRKLLRQFDDAMARELETLIANDPRIVDHQVLQDENGITLILNWNAELLPKGFRPTTVKRIPRPGMAETQLTQ